MMRQNVYESASPSDVSRYASTGRLNRTGISGIIIAGLMVLTGVFLAGCSGIIKDFPETKLFAIAPPKTFGEAGTHDTGKGLLVRQFDISPEFESSFFIYRVSDNRFTGDYYNKFMVSPARMISAAVTEALYNSAFFRPAPASVPSAIDYRLWGKIISLYADVRHPENPLAVMALRLSLEQETDAGFVPKINSVYTVSQPTDGAQPADLVQAWNRCLEQILTNFFRDVKTLD